MSPNELAQEFEDKDYQYFLNLLLDHIPENIDKREGSIIYDAVAPAAMVIGQQSLEMANIIKQTYIKTAQGEFLDYRAVEHGTERYQATNTEAKAVVLDDDRNPLKNVQIGDRFASEGDSPIFYHVIKINDDFTIELQADEAGSAANAYMGQILPVTPNGALAWAEIVEITIPARDVETDDHLRERLLNAGDWIAYGGNIADYKKMISTIPDVGAVQVYPIWNGPGTVKLVILDNDLNPASDTLVKKVKDIIDPEDETALGYGLAPIDHRVTVVAPVYKTVDITAKVQIDPQPDAESVRIKIKQAIEDLFKELRKDWSRVDPVVGRGYKLKVYRSKILTKIMSVDGVIDAGMPLLNGKDEDVLLEYDNKVSELPKLGVINIE